MEHEYSSDNIHIPESLTLLDKALRDPYVEDVISMASTYNVLFDEVAPTDQERLEAIAELDARWDVAMDTFVKFTGTVTVPAHVDDMHKNRSDVECKTVFLDEELVISKGF